MAEQLRYLFYGKGSAYSLHPLAIYMQQQGYDVTELDLLATDNAPEIIESFKGTRCAFMTSYHLSFDRANFHRAEGLTNNSLSVTEVMDCIEPEKSIFYPHDLYPFVERFDIDKIDLFDLVLLPHRNNLFYDISRRCKKVDEVGWIKKQKKVSRKKKKPEEPLNVAYLPSHAGSHIRRYGVQGWLDQIETYVPNTVSLKLQTAHIPEVKQLKSALHERGYGLLDESLSVFDLMDDFDVFIASADSCIVWETAYSGLPVISLWGGAEPVSSDIRNLPSLDWIYPLKFEQLRDFLKENDEMLRAIEIDYELYQPFDFEKAVRLITE